MNKCTTYTTSCRPVNRPSIKDWLSLIRVPFYPVALLPYIAGTIIAANALHAMEWLHFAAGFLFIITLLIGIHLYAEIADYQVDLMSASVGHNKFSGGSQILQQKRISIQMASKAAIIALASSAVIGIAILAHTQNYILLLLGLIAVIGGWGYSQSPLKWARRGLGEIVIAICYGWLPIAAGYMLQTERYDIYLLSLSLPVALSVFNVILINELADFKADSICGKKNLCVRLGINKSIKLYTLISFTYILSVLTVACFALPKHIVIFSMFGGLMLMSIYTTIKLNQLKQITPKTLETCCALTIFQNMLTSLSLIASFLLT